MPLLRSRQQVLKTSPIDNENGLVGWWTLDAAGTQYGLSGRGEYATEIGSPIWVGGLIRGGAQKVAGAINSGTGYSTSLTKADVPTTSDVTFMGWFNSTGNGTNDEWIGITNNNVAAPNFHNVVLSKDTSNKFYFNNYDGSEHHAESNVAWINTTVHVAGVRRSNVNYLYVNGIEQTSTAASGTPNIDASRTIQLGRLVFGSNGTMDDCRVYNRALTPSEINAIYNQGLSAFPLSPDEWEEQIMFNPASGGLGALLSRHRSRVINGGMVLAA